LEKGINPNINDSEGHPILFRMVPFGNDEMIELYLSKGGNLNVIDQDKWNALHCCVLNGHLETTKYLVSVGIDYKAKDMNGRTPLELAKQRKKMEIIDFLEEVQKRYVESNNFYFYY